MLVTEISTPVLFLVFNRPEKTRRVFDVIREARPTKLYVAADAPRKYVESDIEKCAEVKKIVSQIDWQCEVKYLFHENNLGCTLAGITAWNWIFCQEEEMIFIEDDGLISLSFFFFCQELLAKYRYDTRIAYIGGVNYGLKKGNATYFFSAPPAATYSMATWKRVYNLYEPEIGSFNEIYRTRKFKRSFVNHLSYRIFTDKCISYLNNGGNTYDLQMNYLVHKYNMLSIYPNINLSSNIGLDFGGANNDIDPNSSFAIKLGNRERFELSEIIHPEKVEIDKRFEIKHYRLRVFYNKIWLKIYFEYYSHKILKQKYRTILKSIFLNKKLIRNV